MNQLKKKKFAGDPGDRRMWAILSAIKEIIDVHSYSGHSDFEGDFYIYVDDSYSGLGGTLYQIN